MNICYLYYFLTLILCHVAVQEHKVYAAEQNANALVSNNTKEDKTFLYPISTICENPFTSALVCGAQCTKTGDLAVMRSYGLGMPFTSITPEKVTLNTTSESANPLINRSIMHLASITTPTDGLIHETQRVVAVTHQQPNAVFMIDIYASKTGDIVRSIDALCDASGKPCSSVLALASCSGYKNGAVAIVTPNKDTPTDEKFGIAFMSFYSQDVEKDKKKTKEWIFNQVALGKTKGAVQAHPLTLTTPAAAMGHALSHMGERVALHWDPDLERVFIGLDVTSGPDNQDGACALLVGKLVSTQIQYDEKSEPTPIIQLELEPFVPHQAVTDSPAVVAVRGAYTRAAVHMITTFKTTTGLWYTAFVGGTGSDAEKRDTVRVLPLHVGSERTGILAADKDPITIFGTQPEPLLRARYIDKPASSLSDLTRISDRATYPGITSLPGHSIEKIIVAKDALFAIIKGGREHHAGIYHTQALLDAKGEIKGWTAWKCLYQPLPGKYMLTAFYNEPNGYFTLATGDAPDQIDEIIFTGWGSGNKTGLCHLVSFLKTAYKKEYGGIHAYADMPLGTVNPYQGFMAVAGHERMTLVLTTQKDANGQITKTQTDEYQQSLILNDHQQTADPDAKIVHHQGKALAHLGKIEALKLATTDDQALLFVGGTGGLAVYSDNYGNGFDRIKPLIFDHTYCQKQFVPVGSYSFVKRLWYDEGYLYVLTDTQLDRIDIPACRFGPQEHLEKITLAIANEHSGRFLDIVVSGKLALLATTSGLLRTADNHDVRAVALPQDMHWEQLHLDNPDPIIQLIPISTTGKGNDFARHGGGNLYVLQAFSGKNRASIKRLDIQDLSLDPVSSTSITLIPDRKAKHAPIMFRRIGCFTSRIMTDGALWLYLKKNPDKSISSLHSINDVFARHDTQLRIHTTDLGNFSYIEQFAATENRWWALGETVIVHE